MNQAAPVYEDEFPFDFGDDCPSEYAEDIPLDFDPPQKKKKSKRGASPSSQGRKNKELGARGEEAAAHFLGRHGYLVLERNWTCFAGEADIIAIDGETLVFVEVKTRRSIDKGFPSEAVNRAKREKYEMIALAYLQDHFLSEVTVRFDVVAIVALRGGRAFVRHHVGAYSSGW